jgi:hypothetical protein
VLYKPEVVDVGHSQNQDKIKRGNKRESILSGRYKFRLQFRITAGIDPSVASTESIIKPLLTVAKKLDRAASFVVLGQQLNHTEAP